MKSQWKMAPRQNAQTIPHCRNRQWGQREREALEKRGWDMQEKTGAYEAAERLALESDGRF